MAHAWVCANCGHRFGWGTKPYLPCPMCGDTESIRAAPGKVMSVLDIFPIPPGPSDYPRKPCAYCGETIGGIGPNSYEFNPVFVDCEHCGKTNLMGHQDGHFIWRKGEWLQREYGKASHER